jgi:hypothetical protein
MQPQCSLPCLQKFAIVPHLQLDPTQLVPCFKTSFKFSAIPPSQVAICSYFKPYSILMDRHLTAISNSQTFPIDIFPAQRKQTNKLILPCCKVVSAVAVLCTAVHSGTQRIDLRTGNLP